MATYSKFSPWSNTPITNFNLDRLQVRLIPAEDDDFLYEIEPQYRHRPDLLAFDVYGSPELWWVFIQRNIDVLQDPIYDFEEGIKIFLPKKSNLSEFLGI